jgi:hypothetical protein
LAGEVPWTAASPAHHVDGLGGSTATAALLAWQHRRGPHEAMFRLHGFAALVASLVVQTSAVTLRAHDVSSPVQKVVTLLGSLEMKIIKDGEEEQKAFDAFMEWCSTGETDKQWEIKTSKSNIQDLTATIGKAESDVATLSSKIEDVAAAISTNEADLKAATQIRLKERSEFEATEAEMRDTIDTLERAINVLQRKMRSSAMLQAKLDTADVNKLVKVMSTMIDAAALSLHDKQKLLGLVQNSEQQQEQDDDMETDLGAPAAKAYETRSESIVDVLEDLKQKAVTQLEEARREEMNAKHNFELLKQSLEDQISVDTKDLSDSKLMMHDAAETKATAKGEMGNSQKVLVDAQNVLKNMKSDCTQKAADHESTVQNRAAELKALAAAKKAIQQMTTGAASVTYDSSSSFLQIENIDSVNSNIRTGVDLANFEVVNLVRKLAKEERSAALEQLASRISAAIRDGASNGEDPFVKVKGMISQMIERLMKEAGEEAQHKAYCDKEMAGTKQKLDELKYDLEKYGSKIDKAKADSVTLKDEVVTLRAEITEIVKSQGKADALRREEKKVYVQSKTDLEQGLQGVRMALKVLRDYYSSEGDAAAGAASLAQQPEDPEVHSKATGGATGIIGMLEVVESDFGKSLAATEMNEEAAATAYEKLGMENRMSKSMKDKDVEYKTKEAANLDKTVTELTSDQESAQTELDAVLKYSANIRVSLAACRIVS